MKEEANMKDKLKENPFGVPEGYFETMQQEVMEKISAIPVARPYDEETAEPATLLTYLKPAIGLAAVFAIIFGMGYGVMALTGVSKDDGIQTAQLQADIAPSEITMESTGTELTEEEVISIIGDSIDELFVLDNTDPATDILQIEVNEEEIEQYLIDTRVTTAALAFLE